MYINFLGKYKYNMIVIVEIGFHTLMFLDKEMDTDPLFSWKVIKELLETLQKLHKTI